AIVKATVEHVAAAVGCGDAAAPACQEAAEDMPEYARQDAGLVPDEGHAPAAMEEVLLLGCADSAAQ
ncbi:MAG: hypothetical protein RR860_05530, partial [Janthinobacterium sp.]